LSERKLSGVAPSRGHTTLMKFQIGKNPGRDVVQYDYSWFDGASNGGTAAHVSHENASPGNPEQQYACGSNGTRPTVFPWQDEIAWAKSSGSARRCTDDDRLG
jgi:hypothetical protein